MSIGSTPAIHSCTHLWSFREFILGINPEREAYIFETERHRGHFFLEDITTNIKGELSLGNLPESNVPQYYAKLTFSVRDADNNVINSKVISFMMNTQYNYKRYFVSDKFELENFIDKNLFKKIKNNCLLCPKKKYQLLFEVQVATNCDSYLLFPKEETKVAEVIDSNFIKLFEEQKLCDVQLLTRDGKEISAHKAIIVAHSEVFLKMFEIEMKEKTENKVEIKDVDYEVLKLVLNYMYSGKLDNVEEIALQILPVADKYNIEKLKAMCEKEIVKSLKVDTIIEILIFADTYRLDSLINEVIEFIVENASDVTGTAAYEELYVTHPNVVKLIVDKLIKKIPT